MSYNPSIPNANDLLSQSQSQILANFAQLNTLFAANHIEYDNADVADRGKHTFLSMVQQAGDPATAVDEVAIYSKDDGAGNTALYTRKENNGDVSRFGDSSTTLISTVTIAGGETYAEFKDIESYDSYILYYNNLTPAAVSDFTVDISIDNGATYIAANYTTNPTFALNRMILSNDISTVEKATGNTNIYGMNSAATRCAFNNKLIIVSAISITKTQEVNGTNTANLDVDAFRVYFASFGGAITTFTTGVLSLYGINR